MSAIGRIGIPALGHNQAYAWMPQPGPQEALLSCPADEILFGGARGGGKSAGVIGLWLDHCGTWGAAAQGVFFRRQFRDLEGIIEQMKRFFIPLGAVWRVQSASWFFPSGAILRLRHLWDERDCTAYQGHEYTFLAYEEAGQWPTSKPIDIMRATLRNTTGVRCVMVLTANPGGTGHGWLKARYVNPSRMGFKLLPNGEGGTRCFIPSKLTDNRILMDADPRYASRLRLAGSATLVKAWLNGDWDVVVGGAFDENWRPDCQILAPFALPSTWGFRRAFDWGSTRPAALGIWAIADGNEVEELPDRLFPKGSMILIRELYTVQRAGGEAVANTGTQWENDRLGREIAQISLGRRYIKSVADPSIWTRQGGPSIYDQMGAAARPAGDPWDWVKADNSRVAGWAKMREMLRNSASDRPEGPGMWVMDHCSEWIRTVPVLQRDTKKPDDVETEGEDHHGDQTRYAVMADSGRAPAGYGAPISA